MTTKVVKGLMWTLAGQVVPLGVSLITSPIVIRLLGAEGYGVMLLVLLIPGFLSFADFGMGMASTKFASGAYAIGLRDKEARIVRTAALISFLASIPAAGVMVLFSGTIVVWLNVPERLLSEASLSLKIAAITLVINLLCLVFNTPQLTRLRMDLNTLVNAGFRIFAAVAIPIAIFLGGGLVSVFVVLFVASSFTLLGHLFFSGRLLKELFHTSIEREAIRPMLKFGSGLVIASIAALLLINLDKLVLTRVTSVETLAYYSVAATFAGMITLFSGAMVPSLMPAFSQLQGDEKSTALSGLYSRGIRLNLIWVLPVLVFLAIIAKPFFTIWGGPDFGRESPLPFYILLAGLAFNVLAYYPYTAIMASGRTEIFAKLYWIELLPYMLMVVWLTMRYGAVGTAAAWSIRVVADAVIQFWLAKKVGGVSLIVRNKSSLAAATAIMLLPFLALLYFGEVNPAIVAIGVASAAVYALVVWKKLLESEEITWITHKWNGYVNR